MFKKKEETKDKEEEKEKKGLFAKLFSSNIAKKGKVAILLLKENGMAEPLELKSKKGFFSIGGKTYHEDRDCIYTIPKERTPLAIIPEWSMIPYGTKKWHDKSLIQKFTELQNLCINGIRQAEIVRTGGGEGVKMNTKTIVVLAIILVVVIAFLMGYQ